MWKRIALIIGIILAATLAWPARAEEQFVLTPPVSGALLRAYEDVGTYEAGHRGADLAAHPGEAVLAGAQGRVFFVGQVAGTPTVSIDHGNGWRTTYQPVIATVSKGQEVKAGQRIGTVTGGHCAAWCVHWGLTDGTRYADPMAFLSEPQVRLLPHGAQPASRPDISSATTDAGFTGLPVNGRISSPFGMRMHPIKRVWKMHNGVDFAAPCGTPIYSPADGVVIEAGYAGGYGYRVIVDHGGGLTTSYSHLPGIEISVGTKLKAGQRLGSVGTSGLSTGCHLHWMAMRDGTPFDPMSVYGR